MFDKTNELHLRYTAWSDAYAPAKMSASWNKNIPNKTQSN